MHSILTLNNIAKSGLAEFPASHYRISDQSENPEAIIVRSADLHGYDFPSSVLAVARAGAGTNNIPIDVLTKRGIPVFNTPGANANAVKELVIAGILLASRHLCEAWSFVKGLSGDDKERHSQVEQQKKRFVGSELPGKTLGVIGLGAIGVKVANTALALGMRVIGYDPNITVHRAWELSSSVIQANTCADVFKQADFLTLHIPLMDLTRHFMDHDELSQLKKGAVLLNFARQAIVNETALLALLNNDQIQSYVCDFPSQQLSEHPRVLALPHLGASTIEAEENCAKMACCQLRDFLEKGQITNAVNFPDVAMQSREKTYRLCIVNANIPNMVGQISTLLGQANINVIDLINKSDREIAYTLIDVGVPISELLLQQIRSIEGVLKARVLSLS